MMMMIIIIYKNGYKRVQYYIVGTPFLRIIRKDNNKRERVDETMIIVFVIIILILVPEE